MFFESSHVKIRVCSLPRRHLPRASALPHPGLHEGKLAVQEIVSSILLAVAEYQMPRYKTVCLFLRDLRITVPVATSEHSEVNNGLNAVALQKNRYLNWELLKWSWLLLPDSNVNKLLFLGKVTDNSKSPYIDYLSKIILLL